MTNVLVWYNQEVLISNRPLGQGSIEVFTILEDQMFLYLKNCWVSERDCLLTLGLSRQNQQSLSTSTLIFEIL